MTKQQKWFQSWFDTPYYHILYKQRNNKEAQQFMKNLVAYLNKSKDQTILDLACGKGRHSILLNSLGFDVTGVDLSSQSIMEANKSANQRLRFKIHDMRSPLDNTYNIVLNLFTSFGYFDSIEDNFKVLDTIKSSLKLNGIGVIDFMNSTRVLNHLVPQNSIKIDGVHFAIKRQYTNGVITKTIDVVDGKLSFQFKEKVRAFTQKDFLRMISKANLNFVECFGNYNLEPFSAKTSDRLILIFKKNA